MPQHWAVPRRRRGRASRSPRLVTPSYMDEGHHTPLTPHPNDPEYRAPQQM
ncbi:MAG TPA: hypothetical protein VKA98_09360 [Nitrososphaeraceae archaeon]|nr:hypothetical protein [Nitrososphaeraceae archaeon]